MNNLFKYMLVALFFSTLLASAQNRRGQTPVFTIKAAPNQPMPDSIVVRFCKGIISESLQFAEVIRLREKRDGHFTFSFPKKQAISPFVIDFYYKKLNQWSIVYYAEPSDEIEITVTKGLDPTSKHKIGSLVFSGKGAAKYKVCELLSKMNEDLLTREVRKYVNEFGVRNYTRNDGVEVRSSKGKIESADYYKSSEFKKFLNSMFGNLKLGVENAHDTLAKYEKQLSKEVTAFYSYELGYNLAFLSITDFLFRRATANATKEAIVNFYFSKIGSIRPKIPNDSLFKYGLNYRNSMSYYFMYEVYFNNKGNMSPFNVQYDAIKEVKNKELRDILLAKYFVKGRYGRFINNWNTKDSCLNDALKIVENAEVIAALRQQLLFKRGEKMYDFSFLDSTGKNITLKDFKGKVFILDFYYYGCGSCATFAQRFEKEVYPEFAESPDFKVLSVNVDRERGAWMKAVNSGLYTQPSYLNLSTGAAFNHPIFKHYKITSLPWVLLVNKDGRVIDFHLSGKTNLNIKNLIRQALSIKKNAK